MKRREDTMKKKNLSFVFATLFTVGVVITSFPLLLCAAPAPAQTPAPKTLVIGTMKPGTTFHTIALGVLQLVEGHTNMKVSIISTPGEVGALELLKAGDAQLAVCNLASVGRAFQGLFPFKQKYQIHSLVLVAGYIEQIFITGEDTNILTRQDLKGKKVSAGYTGNPGMQLCLKAQLANAGLTLDDIRPVAIAGYVEGVRAVTNGIADACISTIAPITVVRELEARRGIRPLPLVDSAEAIKRMQEVYPGMIARYTSRDDPIYSWIKDRLAEKTPQMAYEIALLASSQLSDDVVYQVTKAVWENVEETHSMLPQFKRDWRVENMCTDTRVLPYHPGAAKWYKEKGVLHSRP